MSYIQKLCIKKERPRSSHATLCCSNNHIDPDGGCPEETYQKIVNGQYIPVCLSYIKTKPCNSKCKRSKSLIFPIFLTFFILNKYP